MNNNTTLADLERARRERRGVQNAVTTRAGPAPPVAQAPVPVVVVTQAPPPPTAPVRAPAPRPLTSSVPPAGTAPPSQSGGVMGWFRGAPQAPTPAASDAALAARIQQDELLQLAAARRAQTGESSGGDADVAGKVYLDDPVWGRWVQPGPPGTRPRWYTVFCLGCCPCFVPPLCSSSRKAALHKVFQTASFILSIIQIAVFIAELSVRGVAPLAINGGIGPWTDTMDWMGAKNAYKIYNGEIVNFFASQSDGQVAGQTPVANRVYSGAQPWRLFTSIFLHSGFIHIALNLTLQLRLALHAEVVWGLWRFVPIYFACGICGALWSAVINPNLLSVGASGALLGVVGAWFSFLSCHWGHGTPSDQQVRKQMLIMTAVNIAIIMIMSAIPFIDWSCHLFGLLSGLLLGLWYFGSALGGPAFAHDAPSLIKAQRAALANAAAISSGAPLPAIPGAIVAGATAASQSQWERAGQGRTLAGDAEKHTGPLPQERVALAVDATSECLCHPMTSINMACGPGAPSGLTRGAILSVLGLVGFCTLVAVGFGLLYGGFLIFPQPLSGTIPGDQIYLPCLYLRNALMYKWVQCPPPYNNLPQGL